MLRRSDILEVDAATGEHKRTRKIFEGSRGYQSKAKRRAMGDSYNPLDEVDADDFDKEEWGSESESETQSISDEKSDPSSNSNSNITSNSNSNSNADANDNDNDNSNTKDHKMDLGEGKDETKSTKSTKSTKAVGVMSFFKKATGSDTNTVIGKGVVSPNKLPRRPKG